MKTITPSRISRLKSLVWCLLIATASAPMMSANVLYSYLADADPVSEGFSPSNTGTAIANDLGFAAWSYIGCGCPNDYHSGVTSQQELMAFSDGWEVDLRARLPQNDNLLFADMDFGNVRYDINLLLSPSGNLTVVLNNFGTGPSYSYAIPGTGTAYHFYQMIYDPGSASASLEVDGVTVLTGYTGHTLYLNDLGLWFGTSGGSGGPGNFNLVEFSANVPEPAPVVFIGGGLVVLVVLGFTRRRRLHQSAIRRTA
jgi:hypothetical protein